MALKIVGFDFTGPFYTTDTLEEKPGVYVILSERVDGAYDPIDVGGSDSVKTRVVNHDRITCWDGSNTGTLVVAVHYTYNWTVLERLIRNSYKFPCGER